MKKFWNALILIWLLLGLGFAILDALDLIKLGFMVGSYSSCAPSDASCYTNIMKDTMLFFIDIITGPIVISGELLRTYGIWGAIPAILIIYLAYGESSRN